MKILQFNQFNESNDDEEQIEREVQSIRAKQKHESIGRYDVTVEDVPIELHYVIKYSYEGRYTSENNVAIYRIFMPTSEFNKLKKLGIHIRQNKSEEILIYEKYFQITKDFLNIELGVVNIKNAIISKICELSTEEFFKILEDKFDQIVKLPKTFSAEKFSEVIKREEYVDVEYVPRIKKKIKKIQAPSVLHGVIDKIIKKYNFNLDDLLLIFDKKLKNLQTKISKINEEKLMLNCLAEMWLTSKKVNTEKYYVKCINRFVSNVDNELSEWATIGFKMEFDNYKSKPTTSKDLILTTYNDNGNIAFYGKISMDDYNKYAYFSKFNKKIQILKKYIITSKA